jgi:hypothetical protein
MVHAERTRAISHVIGDASDGLRRPSRLSKMSPAGHERVFSGWSEPRRTQRYFQALHRPNPASHHHSRLIYEVAAIPHRCNKRCLVIVIETRANSPEPPAACLTLTKPLSSHDPHLGISLTMQHTSATACGLRDKWPKKRQSIHSSPLVCVYSRARSSPKWKPSPSDKLLPRSSLEVRLGFDQP